jgi:Cu/Ag efflux protein CusF
MKRVLFAMGMACACLALRSTAAAQDEVQESTGAVATARVSVEGTVEDINTETREITLKGPEGRTETYTAGPEVRRFDNIKKGDVVQVEYLESVALSLAGENEPSPQGGPDNVTVFPEGEKPSAMTVQTQEVTATVESVDAAAGTVTLKGPKGRTVTLKAGDDVSGRLANLEVGDKVKARYTQALAVDVHKP